MRGFFLEKSLLARLGATALVVSCLILLASAQADAASSSYIDFDRHDSKTKLTAGKESGVVYSKGAMRLARGRTSGTLTSRIYKPSTQFDTLVPSWNASTASGTWMSTQVRVYSGGRWTPWFNMGVWAKGTDTVKRHSVDGQNTGKWRVNTDTLQSIGKVFASGYQYRVTLRTKKSGVSPRVRALFVTSSNSYRHGEFLGVTGNSKFWGKDLPVPRRSQMIYPNGGEVWCSPTSLSMVMAYWSNKTGKKYLNQTVPTVARGTYDYTYGGNGNWPFNTAYASAYGLKASVNRFSSLGQVERWVSRGVPVIASISWNNNSTSTRLSGAAIPASSGHLVVIRGFDRSGKYIIVNDPAASGNSGVRRVYRRDEFARAWFEQGSGGVAYLVYPRGWKVPSPSSPAAKGSW